MFEGRKSKVQVEGGGACGERGTAFALPGRKSPRCILPLYSEEALLRLAIANDGQKQR